MQADCVLLDRIQLECVSCNSTLIQCAASMPYRFIAWPVVARSPFTLFDIEEAHVTQQLLEQSVVSSVADALALIRLCAYV